MIKRSIFGKKFVNAPERKLRAIALLLIVKSIFFVIRTPFYFVLTLVAWIGFAIFESVSEGIVIVTDNRYYFKNIWLGLKILFGRIEKQ